VAFFLVHQPLKIAIKDYRNNRRTTRTQWAERFALMYGSFGALALGFVILNTDGGFLWPLALALPFVAIQIWFDMHNRSRHLLPEISGPTALALVAPALVILDGWERETAFVLWGLLLTRAIPSIFYVRARLRLERDKAPALWPPVVSHLGGLAVVALLVWLADAPWLALIASGILLGRALWGISPYSPPAKPIHIGVGELIYGAVFVILCATGYAL
jgi:hypothetical protein